MNLFFNRKAQDGGGFILALLFIFLFFVLLQKFSVDGLAESTCNEFDVQNYSVDLVSENHCIIGENNSSYKIGFLCKDELVEIYTDRDLEIDLPFMISSKCTYIKENFVN